MTEKTSTKPTANQAPPNGPPEIVGTHTGNPKKRRVLSSPLQAMARIEAEMEKLTAAQKNMVSHWFVATYNTSPTAPQGQS